MYLKSLTIGLIVGLKLTSLQAQESDSLNLKKWRFSSVQILRGFQVGNTISLDANYFKEIDPDHKTVLEDDSYVWSDNLKFSSKPKNLGFYGEFQKINKDKNGYKPNQCLRIGLWYQQRTLGSLYGQKSDIKTIDTLTSDYDGQNIYRFQKHYDTYQFTHEVKELKLDIAYLFNSGFERQAAIFGGIGLNIGSTISSKVNFINREKEYDTYTFTSDGSSNSNLYKSKDFPYTTGSTGIKNNATFGLYLPIGVDYKLSMTHDIYQRIHATLEARPTIDFMRGIYITAMHYNAGLKFDL
jgi:hypothetical protein